MSEHPLADAEVSTQTTSDPTRAPDPARPLGGSGGASARWLGLQAIATVGLFVLGAFYTLYFARAVFIPIVLAVLLKLVLAPLVRRLTKVRIPEPMGAAIVLVLVLGTVGYGAVELSGPASDWLTRGPQSFAMLEYKLRDIKQSVEEVNQKVEELTAMDESPGESSRVVVQGPTLAETLFAGTSNLVGAAVITVVLLYFMLASGDLFLRKTVHVLPSMHDKRRAIGIARRTEREISTYLLTVTVINILLGCAAGLVMWALGMPNPVLWGVLAATLNFIPYVGGIMMVGILGLVSLLTFDTWSQMLLPPAIYLVMTALEGQLITPMVLGNRLALNPVVIFGAMLIWGWLWNVPGLLLAVPLMAAFKIVCDHVEALRPLGQYLGKRDD